MNKKLSFKITFSLMCLLIVITFSMAGFSFAKYVNSAKSAPQGANVAEMNCKYNIEKDNLTFINANFQQQIGDSSAPVQMNNYSSAIITVKNEGNNTGLSYTYGFVFYVPKNFAKHSMFQLLHLDETTNNPTHASGLYSFTNASGELDPTLSTTENEYENLFSNPSTKLDIFFNTSIQSIKTTFTRSFATFPYKEENNNGKLLCSFGVKKTADIEYCRIVLSLDATKYVLKEGDSAKFMLRLVPQTELETEEISIPWNSKEYENQTPVTSSNGYSLTLNLDGTIDVRYQKDDIDKTYSDVYVSNCIGVTFPSRMNVLFSQIEKK